MNRELDERHGYMRWEGTSRIVGSIVVVLLATIPLGCVDVTLLKMRAFEWSSVAFAPGGEIDNIGTSKPTIKFRDFLARHPGAPGPGDTNGHTFTNIRFEAHNKGDTVWTLSGIRCRLLAFSYSPEDDRRYTVTDESGVTESRPFPNVSGGPQVDEFVIKPQGVVGCNLVFATAGYDFGVLVLPFESETGERQTCNLLFSSTRVSRKTIDLVMADRAKQRE
jgi:hypothetical protein